MGAEDQGFKKSVGDASGSEVEHEGGKVDDSHHGWAPDVDEAGGDHGQEAEDKAAEGRETQDAPASESTQEDSDAPPPGVGESVGRRGEEVGGGAQEPGRHDAGTQGESQRPVGTSTARDSSGVGGQDAEDEDSPTLPSGDQGG